MTANCSDEIPFSEDFFAGVSVTEFACILLSGVLSLVTLIVFIETVVFIRKRHERFTSILFKAAIILGVYPAVSLFSLFALCFPKAHLVCDLCTSIYISTGMYNFMIVLIDYFGGKDELLREKRNDKIRLCFAPFCCCCIPPFKITRKVLNTGHLFVGQLAVLQVIFSFISLVLWLDEKFIIGEVSADNAAIYLNVARVISTLLGVGGLRLMVNICESIEESLNIATKSRVLIIVLILQNLQGFIFNILESNDIPECSRELSTRVRGRAWNNMIIILEMFLLGVVARCLARRPLPPPRSNYSPVESKAYPRENPPDTEKPSHAGLISSDQKDEAV